jgi:hypothetical protein
MKVKGEQCVGLLCSPNERRVEAPARSANGNAA